MVLVLIGAIFVIVAPEVWLDVRRRVVVVKMVASSSSVLFYFVRY